MLRNKAFNKMLLMLGIILLSACKNQTSDLIASTPRPKTPTIDNEEMWDLIFISNSSGWHVGEKYAEFIETDLGVKVTLHDFSLGELSARSIVNYLQHPDELDYDLKLKTLGLSNALAEAEVVVIYANPRSAEMGDWDCVSENPYVEDCSPETFAAYLADLKTIYKEIFAIRGSKPIIIRAFDAYNPLYRIFQEQGVFEERLKCWETYNQVIHLAADEFGIPVANAFDSFNGSNHDEDPHDMGLIGSDGIHTSAKGSTTIAELLRELGYEPNQP